MAFERVHAVWDYYDGPRTGVADYNGRPHFFRCIWERDNYAEKFELLEIDSATFEWTTEQWLIWRTWEKAYHSGAVANNTHPGLKGQNPRYDELELRIQERLDAGSPLPQHFSATFRPISGAAFLSPSGWVDLEVEWSCAKLL